MIVNVEREIKVLQDRIAALKKLRPATLARLSISIPVDLIQQARSAGKINLSKICSTALQDFLAQPYDCSSTVSKKIGQTTRVRLNISVPARLKQQIREAKKYNKFKVSEICRQAIQDYLIKLERKS